MAEDDWFAWHQAYNKPDTPFRRRLSLVQEWFRWALDQHPPGKVKVLSVCAGQGQEVIGGLAGHPRRNDVLAHLIEMDPQNAETAAAHAEAAALSGIRVVVGDASLTDLYVECAPADLVLVCGVFGNLDDADVARTISHLPALCATGGRVIWTRHNEPPDLTPAMLGWFAEHGFRLEMCGNPEGTVFVVGVHRYTRSPEPLPRGLRMFTFGSTDRSWSGPLQSMGARPDAARPRSAR